MKQRVLIPLIMILSILFVNALNVNLIEPIDEDIISDGDIIQFKCHIDESSSAENITLRLIKGTTEVKDIDINLDTTPYGLEAIFSWESNGGIWIWTCYADSDTEHFTSQESRTITVEAVNTAPTISPAIPDQTKDINSGTWIIDLSDYANDNEDPIEELNNWSITGADISICNVEIISGDIVTFTPKSVGSDIITFILTDSGGLTDTQDVDITITQSSSPPNNPPTISSIPDQNKDLDDPDWTISLNSYINDEDPDENLNISVSGVDTSIFTVSVDNQDNELTFHIEGEGTDTFTVTVKDTQGATDSTTVKVTIEEETEEDDNDDDEFTDYGSDEFTVEITQSSPSYNNIKIKPEQSQTFTITTNEETNIAWYIDNTKQDETSKSFMFTPALKDIGEHIIKVIVTSKANDNDKDTKTWDIEVEGTTISAANNTTCGNNQADNNETCLTCPEDIPCEQGEYCDEGICKTKQLNKITGFATSTKNFILDKWYYPTLILSITLLIIIITTIVKMQKKPKKDDNFLGEFSEKQTFWKRVQKRLRDWDKKRQLKKKNKENLKTLEFNKKEHIKATAPGIESITSFINQKIYEGNSNREIKRALKKKGWNRRQIRQAFKKIKNDSRKSAQENPNPSQ